MTRVLTGRGNQDTDTYGRTNLQGPRESTAVHTQGERPQGVPAPGTSRHGETIRVCCVSCLLWGLCHGCPWAHTGASSPRLHRERQQVDRTGSLERAMRFSAEKPYPKALRG